MSYKDEIRAIVAGMDNQEHETNSQNQPIEDIYVFVVREHEVEEEDQSNIVESAPVQATTEVTNTPIPSSTRLQKISFMPVYAICILFLFIIIESIIFQLYCLLNPPIATITIIPKSQQLTLNGTLQIGRLLNPITISQSQTVATTGHGHQDARNATGTITFYNGQLNSIFVPAGLILTGNDGEQIVTDQDTSIPASNLPQVGQTTVSAHAISPGSRGNIAAYDINQGCCATAIKAVNTNSFYGGQDQRDFSTVSKQDINKLSTPLKISLAQSMQGALQGQLKPNEQLQILPCNTNVASNHPIGAEAKSVSVTVSETCQAAAYNSQSLEEKATALLTTQAYKKLEAYSLFGNVQVSVKQASVANTPHPLVFLSFKATGTWIYGLSQQSQVHIKELIAGKPKDQALKLIASMPGIERGSISFTGFTDETRLPKNSSYIHIILIVM